MNTSKEKERLKYFSWEDHLNELRRRLLYIIVVFFLIFIISFFIAKPIFFFIKENPVMNNINWNVFHPADAINIYLKFALISAIVFSTPWCLFQIWRYISPGLHNNEKREVLLYVPFSFLLLLLGLFFGYFVVVPFVFSFTSSLNKDLGFVETYGVTQYFSFMFNILISISVLFQLPVSIMFLTRIGLLTPSILSKLRKSAYLILILIADLITPPDLGSQIILSIPLIGLYELSILVSKYSYKRYLKEKKKYIQSITLTLDD